MGWFVKLGVQCFPGIMSDVKTCKEVKGLSKECMDQLEMISILNTLIKNKRLLILNGEAALHPYKALFGEGVFKIEVCGEEGEKP